MSLSAIPLDRLHAHPSNSNVMPPAVFGKLCDHLDESGRYPPVVVRPFKGGDYQILDGHHRVEALRRLGRDEARCVVWDVDDAGALLLLSTLNRLEGRDDPRKRAALLAELGEHLDVKAMAAKLPEDAGRLKRLLRLNDVPPPPRPPRAMADMPVAVHFFLLPAQRAALERRLREVGGPREEALLSLVGVTEPGDEQPTEND
ncbi:MAG: ParB N-terminal domain-containing protein [Planctomycetota bacterium]